MKGVVRAVMGWQIYAHFNVLQIPGESDTLSQVHQCLYVCGSWPLFLTPEALFLCFA